MIQDFKLSNPFNYENDTEYSLKEPKSFWNDVSKRYSLWDKEYDKIHSINNETNKSEWFKGGLINACYNVLDKNILNGKKNEIAFIYEIPIKKLSFKISYQELYDRVCIFSRALKNLGVTKGDIVLMYMHNSFEAIISMLSCARLGATHNVIYSGTLPEFLSKCISESKPKVIISSNFGLFLDDQPLYYLPLLKEALDRSTHKPNHVVIYNRNDIKDGIDIEDPRLSNQQFENSIDWFELVNNLQPLKEYTPVESQHPFYINYSSGTTNTPKGIVRETGGTIVELNYEIRNVLGLDEGDVAYFGSPFAWISCHSFLIYGMLIVGGTGVFIEGPIKDPSNEIWEIVSKNNVKGFLLTPSLIRKIRILDPNLKNIEKFNLSKLKTIYVGGEMVDQTLLDYLKKSVKVSINIAYGQTEQGGMFITHPNGVSCINDELGKPSPGYNVKIVKRINEDCDIDSNNNVVELKPNEIGEIVIKLPLPPMSSNYFLNDDKESSNYNSSYLNSYKGYFSTGDLGFFDENGYVHFVGRAGDSITFGNHSINSGTVEAELIKRISLISECCIVPIKNEILSSIPGVFFVLKQDSNDEKIINSIKNEINLFFFNLLQTNEKYKPIAIKLLNIPKNRNGKSIRPLVKSIFNGEKYSVPATLENEDVINELLLEYNKFKLSN